VRVVRKSSYNPAVFEIVTHYSLHLLVSVLGTMLGAAIAVIGFSFIWDVISPSASATSLQQLGTQRPFPIQLFSAFLLGGLVAPRLSSPRLGSRVWIVPMANLLVRMALWQPSSVVSNSTVWEHFFGACTRRFCPDQFLVTLPFYTAAVYSFAALLSTRNSSDDQTSSANV
jgi:hypothetical protein